MIQGLVIVLGVFSIVMASFLTLAFALKLDRQKRRQIIGAIVGGTLGLYAGAVVGFEFVPIDSSLGPHGPALAAAMFHGLFGGLVATPIGAFAGWLLLSRNQKY